MAPHRTISRSSPALVLGLVIALAGCDVDVAAPPPPPEVDDALTVGSFDFPESELIAEIYAQSLEAHGVEVIREFAVGPRELTMPALERGLLEVMPEYSGSALGWLGGTPSSDPTTTDARLRAALEARGLVALAPAAAQDRNVFVMTEAAAARLDVGSLSDLTDVAAQLTIGGPPECPLRPLCLAGLGSRYGLRFGRFVPLDASGPVTLQALDEGLVDVALLFSTHPRLVEGGLRVLSDDRDLQPAEEVVPLVTGSAAGRFGHDLADALGPVSGALTTEALRSMNAQVAGGAVIADVARAWLENQGLD